MSELIAYDRGSRIMRRYSEALIVDPNIDNNGKPTPAGGSVFGYPYTLPYIQRRMFPVRGIRIFDKNEVQNAITPGKVCLTLRGYDGQYFAFEVPGTEFAEDQNTVVGVSSQPLIFTPDFLPDPRMSYVQFVSAGETSPCVMRWIYA